MDRDDWANKDWERYGRCKSALVALKMEEHELADLAGVKRRHLSQIMWGMRRPRHFEECIAKALGKTWEELFGPLADSGSHQSRQRKAQRVPA